MSKVNCEAVGKRRQASLRMARAELLLLVEALYFKGLTLEYSAFSILQQWENAVRRFSQ